jgi:hypothetical protein
MGYILFWSSFFGIGGYFTWGLDKTSWGLYYWVIAFGVGGWVGVFLSAVHKK